MEGGVRGGEECSSEFNYFSRVGDSDDIDAGRVSVFKGGDSCIGIIGRCTCDIVICSVDVFG